MIEEKQPGWDPEFQRLVIACAVRGDLLSRLPSAFRPELFGPTAGAQSPRQRIAAAVAAYWKEYGSRPSAEIFREVVRKASVRLPERETVEQEAAAVLAVELPEDLQYVHWQVREWAELRSLEQGVLQAAGLLASGPTAVGAAREALAKAARPIEEPGRRQTVQYVGDSAERLASWRLGDEYGERIPTGFEALDGVLKGGPTRGEVFYFLAPPKGAKTAALLHVALHAARRRFGVYVATYEMRAVRMALRLDRAASKQSKESIRSDTAGLERALQGLQLAAAGEIVIDERPPQQPGSVAEVVSRVKQIRREGGHVDVVVLDYLNIMGSSQSEREKRHELARISRDIAAAARELDVLVWSAALVNRAAVGKRTPQKKDIAESYEVIAVADGMVVICATPSMVQNGFRRFYVMAAREEADEVRAGDYKVDFSTMVIEPAGAGDVDALIAAEPDKQDGRE